MNTQATTDERRQAYEAALQRSIDGLEYAKTLPRTQENRDRIDTLELQVIGLADFIERTFNAK
jgi:hypothetical protein